MTTVVIGGGLAGVTTLYALAARGEDVILLEAAKDVALGASHANGSMITPSMADPWNGPGVARHLISSLFDPGAAMKLRFGQIPDLAGWGLTFLRNATRRRHEASTLANFRLAAYSARETWRVADELGLSFDASARGTLKVFESAEAMAGPLSLARAQEPLGLAFRLLDAAGAVSIEPCLEPIAWRIHGALFYPDDRVGDARQFTQQLASAARQHGAQLRMSTPVERIVQRSRAGFDIVTRDDRLHADRVVVAAATATPALVRSLGIRLSIKPAKGYSLTMDMAGSSLKPSVAVVDDAMHAAVVPLGDRLRAVGTAEFAGMDRTIDRARIDNLAHLFERLYPAIASQIDVAGGSAWAGLRPMSADGRPFIGETKVKGLWVNSGHGHLGWTKAVGSALLLTQLILGDRTDLDPAPYAVVGRRV